MADSEQRIYVAPHPVNHEEAEAALKTGANLNNTMVGVAFYEADRVWAQDFFVRCASHPDSGVRWLAPTCFGHLARIHGEIDEDIVLPALVKLYNESVKSRGQVDDAISDIHHFLRWDKTRRRAFYRVANKSATSLKAHPPLASEREDGVS